MGTFLGHSFALREGQYESSSSVALPTGFAKSRGGKVGSKGQDPLETLTTQIQQFQKASIMAEQPDLCPSQGHSFMSHQQG